MVIDELIAVLGFQVEGQGNLDKFNSMLNQAEKQAKSFALAVSNTAIVVGGAFATAMSALGHSVIQTGALFEGLDVQLAALEGSSEKGKQALEWIREFAGATPLSLSETANAFVQLKNFGIDPTNGSLMAAVDSAALMGKGIEHVMGITLAMGQAWSRGKLQGNDILQMIDRGIPVWDLLSKVMGKSVEEVQELSSKGKIGRREMQLFFDEMGKRASGASEKMSKTWSGIVGRMGDVWEDFNKRIADAGVFDDAKSRLESVMEVLTGWQKDGTFDKAAKTASDFMRGFLNAFGIFVDRISTHIGFLSANFDKLRPFIQYIGYALVALTAYARPVMTAFLLLGLAIDDFMTYLEGGESLLGDFIDGLSELAGIPKRAAGEIIALGLAIGAVLIPMMLRILPRLGGLMVTGLLRGLLGPAGLVLIGAEIISSLLGVNLFDVGYKIMMTLLDGMKSVTAAIRNTVDSIFGVGHSDEMQKIVDAAPVQGDAAVFGGGNKAQSASSRKSWWEWFGGKPSSASAADNLNGNLAKINSAASSPVLPSTVNDSRDQSQTVNVTVGGVTVQGVQNVTAAVGSAVGQAVGNSAAGAVPPSRVIKQGSAF